MNSIVLEQEKQLHPLAQRSSFAERMVPLPDEKDGSAARTLFARDRDRIIFSKAFRRLTHKTQLYISHEGNEHNRTRLTHSFEVGQIARAIARNLSMNEELVEAIAYGHDVGHAPFGHAGERQINCFLRRAEPLPSRLKALIHGDWIYGDDSNSDFRHNYQSVRILSFLEKYHPDYDGLNLTVQCLEGILKHTKLKPIIEKDGSFKFPGLKEEGSVFSRLDLGKDFDKDLDKGFSVTIEGQIVSIADEIAQVAHDTNDALRIGALKISKLLAFKSIADVLKKDEMRYPKHILKCKYSERRQHAQIMSALINYFIRYVVEIYKDRIQVISRSVDKRQPFKLSDWLIQKNEIKVKAFADLKNIKDDVVLNNYTVNRMDNKGEYFIRNLFDAYLNNPRQLPDITLASYCQIKRLEITKLGEKKFTDWLISKQKQYRITSHLRDDDLRKITGFLKEDSDGHDFRLLPSDLIEKLLPYLIIDNDFMRTVADYVSGMTDKFAQEEYARLYSV